jgi:hypothetical protein
VHRNPPLDVTLSYANVQIHFTMNRIAHPNGGCRQPAAALALSVEQPDGSVGQEPDAASMVRISTRLIPPLGTRECGRYFLRQ